MTAPNSQPITHTRGDDFDRVITFSEDPATFQNIWFTIRESWATTEPDDSEAVYQAELNDGITVTGPLTAAISIPAVDTLEWESDDYVYDVQILTAAGKIRTTQRGHFHQEPDVTRAGV